MSSTASKRKAKRRVVPTSRKLRRVTASLPSASKAERQPPVSTPESLFLDLGFSAEEARLLTIKSDLCNQILKIVRKCSYSQKDLAKIWGKPQPRVSEILNCKLSLFSIDMLVTYLGQLGVHVTLAVARERKAAS